MTAWAKLAIALLPGGLIAVALREALRCRHRHELLDFGDVGQWTGRLPPKQDIGGSIPPVATKLRCADCGRTRPHPWAGEPVRYTMPVMPAPAAPTGIEREAERAAAEDVEINVRVMRLYK